jgi:hypothetical protein
LRSGQGSDVTTARRATRLGGAKECYVATCTLHRSNLRFVPKRNYHKPQQVARQTHSSLRKSVALGKCKAFLLVLAYRCVTSLCPLHVTRDAIVKYNSQEKNVSQTATPAPIMIAADRVIRSSANRLARRCAAASPNRAPCQASEAPISISIRSAPIPSVLSGVAAPPVSPGSRVCMTGARFLRPGRYWHGTCRLNYS